MREMKVRGYSLDEGQWIKGFGAEYNDDSGYWCMDSK